MSKTVVTLSTYPIERPMHGGQIRMANIKSAYEKYHCNVTSIAICVGLHGFMGRNDISVRKDAPELLFEGATVPFLHDLKVTDAFFAEDSLAEKLISRLPRKIDIIHVEQPFLWPIVRMLRHRGKLNGSVCVYGSQNVESELKSEILEGHYGKPLIDRASEEIKNMEIDAATSADVVFAVTEYDKKFLEDHGATNVILAMNGVEPRKVDFHLVEKWRTLLPQSKFPIYCASAHPPNFEDFFTVMGGSLAWLPPDSKLVVLGSVSDHIIRECDKTIARTMNKSRLLSLGTVSNSILDVVKHLASAFIIPIMKGGGSNLKTAEAIHTGKPVLTTTVGIRGFEEFIGLPGIFVTDNPKEFRDIGRHLIYEDLEFDENEARSREGEKLIWENCLNEAIFGVLERSKNA